MKTISRVWHGVPLPVCPADPPSWLGLSPAGEAEWWRVQRALQVSGRWHGLDFLLVGGYVDGLCMIEAAEGLPEDSPDRQQMLDTALEVVTLAAEALAVPLGPDHRLVLPFGGVQ